MNRSAVAFITIILLAVISGLVFITVRGSQEGTLSGRVSIGPLCPVEPCRNPPQDIYSSRELLLKPPFGEAMHVKLEVDGTFQAKILAGTYTVNLTNCTFRGCEAVLPRTVIIAPNQITILEINIDTGIR